MPRVEIEARQTSGIAGNSSDIPRQKHCFIRTLTASWNHAEWNTADYWHKTQHEQVLVSLTAVGNELSCGGFFGHFFVKLELGCQLLVCTGLRRTSGASELSGGRLSKKFKETCEGSVWRKRWEYVMKMPNVLGICKTVLHFSSLKTAILACPPWCGLERSLDSKKVTWGKSIFG